MNEIKHIVPFLILILASPTVAPARPVPDTGQTQSYTDTFGEDSDYSVNPPSYTKLDIQGNELPDSAISWGMVRDNVTGLIWEVKQDKDGMANYSNPHDADNTYTWYDSNPNTNRGDAGMPGDGTDTEDFINALNVGNFGGFSDWRLPAVKELSYIMDSGTSDPNINAAYFPNTLSSYYWSSSTFAEDNSNAWLSFFYNGFVGFAPKSYAYYVRAVHGLRPERSERLEENGDGTVTDTYTGLMWQEATAVPTNWDEAIAYCEGLSLAGYDDWRMPNRNELQSLTDYSVWNPSIDINVFPTTALSYYWTSTTEPSNGSNAGSVYFGNGFISNYDKSYSYCVRAVRGGQNQLPGHLVISGPEQGDNWKVGVRRSITWDPQGIGGNVRISLSREGGKTGTFETLVESTENDGSFLWIVTGPDSVNCALRIEPLIDPGKGATQGLFGISASCEGDLDGDGDVDGSDLAVFVLDFGRTDCASGPACQGDFDGDGDVDGSDLAIFAADFGRTDCPTSP